MTDQQITEAREMLAKAPSNGTFTVLNLRGSLMLALDEIEQLRDLVEAYHSDNANSPRT